VGSADGGRGEQSGYAEAGPAGGGGPGGDGGSPCGTGGKGGSGGNGGNGGTSGDGGAGGNATGGAIVSVDTPTETDVSVAGTIDPGSSGASNDDQAGAAGGGNAGGQPGGDEGQDCTGTPGMNGTAGKAGANAVAGVAGLAGVAKGTDYFGPAPDVVPASNTQRPVISGTVRDGQTLKTSNGEWSIPSGLAFSYQWQLCSSTGKDCQNITGATHPSYKLNSADLGNEVTVVVTATDTDGKASDAAATPVGPVADPPPRSNTSLPTSSGTIGVDQTLTAIHGNWSSHDLRRWSGPITLGPHARMRPGCLRCVE
jgi:hypothetical protein